MVECLVSKLLNTAQSCSSPVCRECKILETFELRIQPSSTMAANLRIVRNPPLSLSRMQFRDASLVFSAIGLLASVFAFVGDSWWIQGARSQSWTVVDGEVQSYEVFGTGSKRSESVRYTYRFGTNDFENTRKSFGFKDGSQFEDIHPRPSVLAREVRNVKVWVNPADPAQAVLYPGVSFVTKIWTIAFGLAFIFVATLGIAFIKTHRVRG
jgi:hypothetical protein